MGDRIIWFRRARKSSKAREEAFYWLVSIDEGLSADERVRLEAWLAADPSHAIVLVEMAKRWDEQSVLSELSEVVPLEHAGHPPHPYAKWAVVALALAAVGSFSLFGLGYIAWNVDPDVSGERAAHAAEGTYQTAIGERRVVRLTDGSAVTMNTDTSIDVQYSAKSRVILLERGEAVFDVAHDAERPFEVHVGGHVIRALGTVFNVRLRMQDAIVLMVNEGRVEVQDRASAEDGARSNGEERSFTTPIATVGASEMAILEGSKPAEIRSLDKNEISDRLAWQRGMFVFRGERLDSVIDDVSRYTTTRFVIADDSIRDMRVGGYFRIDDIDALLLALEESFGVVPTHVDDDLIVLTSQASN